MDVDVCENEVIIYLDRDAITKLKAYGNVYRTIPKSTAQNEPYTIDVEYTPPRPPTSPGYDDAMDTLEETYHLLNHLYSEEGNTKEDAMEKFVVEAIRQTYEYSDSIRNECE